MQANWSLILNVLLLIGVIVAIGRLMKARKQSLSPEPHKPSLGSVANSPYDAQPYNDDIIAVRKVNSDLALDLANDEEPEPQLISKPAAKAAQPQLLPQEEDIVEEKERGPNVGGAPTLMMFLLAKDNRLFAGYELLQTVLAAGLRFGEGHLFHRHQFSNGQGPVICSLAAATATGVFDLQNIGAFSVRGLCLFMQASNNPSIDEERFSIMLETARQLSDGMDAHLLDDQRKPLTEARIERYYRLLNCTPSPVEL
ncbi:cell division protein ZipA C-terminal FtsZ-binding domain-containing protein [uncultured Legionella sp.]|uniref:cell division protein ZipA C-terminal FtsZ-binding domain-containing protein n=1 Tax=uncultured Legionella sp. TaxID=210934 RepID=UPI002605E3FE|nr:cell division protein ZipA C-terminal FtsZ-binding domain-containing protein [uncultured Legionella sp.]